MRFDNKVDMTVALLAGKRFRVGTGGVIYYDERFTNSFRFENTDIGVLWELYNQDIWTEIGPRHVHQDLMDSYQDGQAWQCATKSSQGSYMNIKNQDRWVEPSWDKCIMYRLHPHNTLIQAHLNGAEIQVHNCGNWVREPNPCWYEDNQYRIKPVVKTVYEWMYKTTLSTNWMFEDSPMSEEEAKNHFGEYDYRKTGRSWEIEV
jgi:hypothetical protein